MAKHEILFRGKRVDNGEWEQGAFEPDALEMLRGVEGMDGFIKRYNPEIRKTETFEVVRETVGLYTGLKDRNGTKIFEGDIVKSKKYGKIVGHSNVNDYDVFAVTYEPCMFRLINKTRGFNLADDGYSKFEVIGNIHDNPDLLKE